MKRHIKYDDQRSTLCKKRKDYKPGHKWWRIFICLPCLDQLLVTHNLASVEANEHAVRLAAIEEALYR